MKNYYETEIDTFFILVDGKDKYGIKIYIDLESFNKVNSAIDGCWQLDVINNKYVAFGYKNGKKVYLNEIVGNNVLLEINENNAMNNSFNLEDINQKSLYEIINHIDSMETDNIKDARKVFFDNFKNYIEESLKCKINKRLSALLYVQRDLINKYETGNLTGYDLYKYGNISIEQIYYEELSELEYANTSEILLPNHEVILYQNIKEQKASKDITCMYSGSVIRKGSYYIYYKPFLEDLTDGICYTISRPIKCDSYYSDELPTNIKELDELSRRLFSSYENNDDYSYNFLTNYGSDRISLIKIRKKRR